jgi:hypothetical protein
MDFAKWLKDLDPFVVSVAFLLLLWLLYTLATREPRVWQVAIGADGQYSTSKFQVFLWTVVVLFSFVAIFWARWRVDRASEQLSDIPANVLTALGFVIVSGIASYAITASKVEEKQDVKLKPGQAPARWSALFEEDRGVPSLHKIQLLAWTAVALITYLFATASAVGATVAITTPASGDTPAQPALPALPDIDATLMVLMGLGQGAYLGRKLTLRQTIGITRLDPSEATVGDEITVSGVGFGEDMGTSTLEFDAKPVTVRAADWSDTSIKFKVPDKHPDGSAWPSDPKRVSINVRIGGQPGATAPDLLVKAKPPTG